MDWFRRTLRTTAVTIFGIGLVAGFLALLVCALLGWVAAAVLIANGLYLEGTGVFLLWTFCLAGVKELK